MARSQVADAGMASNMQVSCEYTEYAVADIRQGVVLQLGNWHCYETCTVHVPRTWTDPSVWIDLVQDRGRWRTLVRAVMNLRVSYSAGDSLAS